jgi:hypothetical protein
MNLKNSQLDVDNWIKEHGVRYFNEPTNMAQQRSAKSQGLCRRYGEQSEKVIKQRFRRRTSRCSFVVLCLANQTGIDLQAAFDKKWI